jgi:hypothetical protein
MRSRRRRAAPEPGIVSQQPNERFQSALAPTIIASSMPISQAPSFSNRFMCSNIALQHGFSAFSPIFGYKSACNRPMYPDAAGREAVKSPSRF